MYQGPAGMRLIYEARDAEARSGASPSRYRNDRDRGSNTATDIPSVRRGILRRFLGRVTWLPGQALISPSALR